MNDHCIIDNLISEESQDKIEDLLSDKNFPWFYINGTIFPKKNGLVPNNDDTGFFNHYFIQNNEHFSEHTEKIISYFKIHEYEINHFLNKNNFFNVSFSDILRLQSNFLLGGNKFALRRKTPFHVDSKEKHIVLIYYVNNADSGSKTILKNKISVSPKKGRGLFFIGDIEHKVILPKTNRVVLNFNFKF